MSIKVFHRDSPSMYLPLISKDARLIIWPGVDAWRANLAYVRLEADESNKPHVHTISEDTIFILEGEGTIRDFTNGVDLPFRAGCLVHVPVGIEHAVMANKGVGIVSIGGPTPADLPLLKALDLIPADSTLPDA